MATASLLQSLPIALTAMPPLGRSNRPERRLPKPAQGRALSTLAHAIEYLIDTRIAEGGTNHDENEAVRLMMACSRAVFEECTLYKPLSQRVTRWIVQHLRPDAARKHEA